MTLEFQRQEYYQRGPIQGHNQNLINLKDRKVLIPVQAILFDQMVEKKTVKNLLNSYYHSIFQ